MKQYYIEWGEPKVEDFAYYGGTKKKEFYPDARLMEILNPQKYRQEVILCAATWYKELHLIRPDVLKIRGFAPYNIQEGIVFCGWRHPSCLYQKVAITGLKDCESGEYVQGFLTSKNIFVDRVEAMKIAKAANQLQHKPYNTNRLHSEDLY